MGPKVDSDVAVLGLLSYLVLHLSTDTQKIRMFVVLVEVKIHQSTF